jgi:NAD(P)-dependent dehydrogenase (short-subunit alcohol dehydrogenase family)
MSNQFELKEKRYIITGASSGIGRSIALAVSSMGGETILIGRNRNKLEETASCCQSPTHVFPFDLSNIDTVAELPSDIAEQYGPISGLVHSAGIYQLAPLRALRSKNVIQMFEINALAGVLLVKGLLQPACFVAPASVVFISSVAGHVGEPGALAYGMSKGAVEQAVKTLSLELRSNNIRVNAIAPSMIETPMIQKELSKLSDEQRETLIASMPGGIGQPEDVAWAAVYLLSDASRMINGISLLVDNGYCAK